MKRPLSLLLLACCSVALLALALLVGSRRATALAPVSVSLAMPVQLSLGAVPVGLARGMFEQRRVHLDTQSFKMGKHALDAVITGGADMAIVADTPYTLAALRGEQVVILASLYGSRKAMAVLGWRARGIAGPADLAGKTIGTVAGTNAHFFLEALLVAHGIERQRVNVVELKPEVLNDALRSGRVDAVTLWQPDLRRMQRELGAAGHTVYGEDIFVYRFLLATSKRYLNDHHDEAARVVAALADATDFIHDEPAAARAIIGRAIGVDAAALVEAFDAADYHLTLDQSLLLSLSDVSRWARRSGLVRESAATPDFVRLIDQAPLQAARPAAVRIIQ